MSFYSLITYSLPNIQKLELFCKRRDFKIAGEFRISRGAKRVAQTIYVELRAILKNGEFYIGRGESIPYGRYGESCEIVHSDIERVRSEIESNVSLEGLQSLMPPGAARNAVDSALWDLYAKILKQSVWDLIKKEMRAVQLKPLPTAFTLSVNTPEEMAKKAHFHSDAPLLKIKLTGDRQDMARVRAVLKEAPQAKLILDANEAWDLQQLNENAASLEGYNVMLIEQPLRSDRDYELKGYTGKIPLCADESCHDSMSFERIKDYYHAINIKLDKTGGLTDAIQLKKLAQKAGKKILSGCMVGTSLGIAPAFFLAQDADWVDLDGPLLMAEDYRPAIQYKDYALCGVVPALWG